MRPPLSFSIYGTPNFSPSLIQFFLQTCIPNTIQSLLWKMYVWVYSLVCVSLHFRFYHINNIHIIFLNIIWRNHFNLSILLHHFNLTSTNLSYCNEIMGPDNPTSYALACARARHICVHVRLLCGWIACLILSFITSHNDTHWDGLPWLMTAHINANQTIIAECDLAIPCLPRQEELLNVPLIGCMVWCIRQAGGKGGVPGQAARSRARSPLRRDARCPKRTRLRTKATLR